MVILETAAIGAAGYGLYRGGDAVVRQSKSTHQEWQREKVRQSQRESLQSKTKARQERIAALIQSKEGGRRPYQQGQRQGGGTTTAGRTVSGTTAGSGGVNHAGRIHPAVDSKDGVPPPPAWSTTVGPDEGEDHAPSVVGDVDDRYATVMAKLRASRGQQGQGPQQQRLPSSSSSVGGTKKRPGAIFQGLFGRGASTTST